MIKCNSNIQAVKNSFVAYLTTSTLVGRTALSFFLTCLAVRWS